MRTAIITALLGALALATAAPQSKYNDNDPGGSVVLIDERSIIFMKEAPGHMYGSRTRQHVEMNKLAVLNPPGKGQEFHRIEFDYFLNVNETKVQCHTFHDAEGFKPFGMPLMKSKPLKLRQPDDSVVVLRSILCLIIL